MQPWMKALLAGVIGFGTGAGAVSQADPNANATTILITGAVTAANAIAALFVQKPTKTN